jgi:hypothetical protein
VMGLYTFAYEYSQDVAYSGGVERQYIYVYEVTTPIYPYGMVTAGRAEKLCGADFYPSYA